MSSYMTDGEKMIWAAVFAKRYDISNPPAALARDLPAGGAWEAAQTEFAIEAASGAVERMREAGGAIDDGATSFAANSLRTMRGMDRRRH